jgi:hypothetical protein
MSRSEVVWVASQPETAGDVFDPMQNAGHPSWFDMPEIGEDGIAHHVEYTPGVGHQCLPDCPATDGHAFGGGLGPRIVVTVTLDGQPIFIGSPRADSNDLFRLDDKAGEPSWLTCCIPDLSVRLSVPSVREHPEGAQQ